MGAAAILRIVLAPLVAAAAAMLLTAMLEPIDRLAFERRLALRPDAGWPDDLVLVAIDDASIHAIGRWPWRRSVTGELLTRLRSLGAKTVLLDASIAGESDPAEDEALARSLDGVVTAIAWSADAGERFDEARVKAAMLPVQAPPEWIAPRRNISMPIAGVADNAAALGHTALQVKSDDRVRSAIPLLGVEGMKGSIPALSLAGWLHQRGLGPGDVTRDGDILQIKGSPPIRLHGGEMYLDVNPSVPFPDAIQAKDVFTADPEGPMRKRVEGKLAFVFVDSIISPDALPSAYGAKTPGGKLLALSLRTFEHASAPRPMGRFRTLFVVAFLLGAAGATPRLRRQPAPTLLGIGVVTAILLVVVAFALVPIADLFAPVAAPAACALVWSAVMAAQSSRTADADRRRLRELLRGVPRRGVSAMALENADPESATRALGSTGVTRGSSTVDTSTLLETKGAFDEPVQVGRYLVQRALGRGGMGAIFLAMDQDLGRPVAMKILEAQSRESFERFRREATAVARLVHPNVVQIHEVGFDASVPYIVMEYVPGGTLSDLLRDPDEIGPMVWERSTRLMIGVAKGLGAAHKAGIVHRDVKPSNLLLAERRGTVAKIADFGIAKLSGGESLTQEGTFIGTVGYLAPEQAMGEAVSPRSDVYSLGVTFYRTLTGRHAFEGSTAEMLRASIRQSVPDPRAFNPTVPVPLARYVSRMTSLRPEDRPADGNVVAVELEAVLAELERR